MDNIADHIVLNPGSGGATLATDEVALTHFQIVKMAWGADGSANPVAAGSPMPVSVQGSVAVTGSVSIPAGVAITGTASVTGSVSVSNKVPVSLAAADVTGGPIPVSGTVSITGVTQVSGRLPVDIVNPLPVSGTVNVGNTVPISINSTNIVGNVPVSGSVSITGTASVTGSVTVTNKVAVSLAVADVTGGNLPIQGTVSITGITHELGRLPVNVQNPVTVTGSVSVSNKVPISLAVTDVTGGPLPISGNVGITGTVTIAEPVTVDGTVNVGTSGLPSGAATEVKQNNEIAIVQVIADAVKQDGAGFTPGSSKAMIVGGEMDDAATAVLAEGQAGAARITAYRAIHVNLRDALGNEVTPTGGGGGTQYDEDTATQPAEKLTMAGVIRKDTPASLVDVDGDRTELIVGSTGRLHVDASGPTLTVGTHAVTNAGTFAVQESGTALTHLSTMAGWNATGRAQVNIIAGQVGVQGGSGASNATTLRVIQASDDPMSLATQALDDVIKVDSTLFATTTDKVTMVGALFDDAAVNSVQENDAGALRMSANRNLYVNVRDAAGAERGLNVDAGGRIGVTNGGTFVVQENGSALTALNTMSAWNASGRAMVNIIAGQPGVAAGAGAVGADVQRMTLASNDPAVTAIQLLDDIAVVDDAIWPPEATRVALIGGFADETTPNLVDEGDAGAVRMTLARALHVNLRSAAGVEITPTVQYDEDSIPGVADKLMIAGTIRKDVPSTSLVNADGDYAAMIVDGLNRLWTHAVITDELPAGDNLIGKVDINSTVLATDAATATKQDIGNSSLTTLSGAVTGNRMQVDVVTSVNPSGAATAVNQGTEITHLSQIEAQEERNGTEPGATVISYGRAVINAAASGDNTIVAAQAAGQRIRVLSYALMAGGTVNATWKSGVGTSISGALPLVVNTGVSSGYDPMGHLETAAATALILNLSAAIQVSGHVHYAVVTVP